ncbi:MAG TPA: glycosyltransferase family 39 protein [Burkholderiales bacterium]|nr:glycosyltransferase family 39 protein [Burkholderiales bacterium]
MTAAAPTQRQLWLLLFAALIIWCGNLEYRSLALSDEGRYSEIPRYMVASGDWLTPRLDGIKYFEKPPLQYWTTALAYEAFGMHQWTARLWPALTGMLGVLTVFYAGRRLFGTDCGLYAALVLGSSLLYALIAHINTLDMGLTFFLGLGLAAMLIAFDSRTAASSSRRWMYAAWAAFAGATLSKGLIGIVLPAAAVILYMLFKRDFSLWRKLHPVGGGVLFLLLCAPWFVAISIANPEFPWFFFVHEHLQRYTTTLHNRYQPWYYFIPVLLAGMLPWTVTLLDTLFYARRQTAAGFDHTLFLLLWSGFVFVFFSLSDSKLVSYILPMLPALALLIALRLPAAGARAFTWQMSAIALLALLGLFAAPQLVRLANTAVPAELYRAQVPWLIAAAAVLLAGCIAAIFYGRRNRLRPAVIVAAFASLLAGQLALASYDELAPLHSAHNIAEKIKPYLRPGAPFYSVATYDQTLPFYIDRTVTPVAFQDELAFGLRQEPALGIPDLAEFEHRWHSNAYALAIMEPDMFERLRQDGLPMREIARDAERVVVVTTGEEH